MSAQGQLFETKQFSVDVTSNVVYGVETIHITTTPVDFNLLLDLYEPTGAGVPALKPGIVFAHGGAWIVGSKDDVSRPWPHSLPGSDTFDNPNNPGVGDTNTPTKDYAQAFAERGYVTVSIDYRMILDFPAGTGFVADTGADLSGVIASTQNRIPSLTATDITNGFEASIADVITAVQWMKTNAAALGVDPNRIVLAGHSAGAVNALFAAYRLGEEVGALFINSGNLGSDFTGFVPATTTPAIFFQGDNDDLADVTSARALVMALENQGVTVDYIEMAGEDHYYKIDRPMTGFAQNGVVPTLEDLASGFLFVELDLAIDAAPVVLCRDVEIVLDSSGQATLVWWEVDAGSFDPNGDPISLAIDKTSFDFSDLGTQVVTLTLTDVNGLESTCSAIVTVVDGGDPPIECPEDILVIAEEAGGLPSTHPEISEFLSGATVPRNIVDFEDVVALSDIPGLTIFNGTLFTDPVDVLGVPTELDTNGDKTLANGAGSPLVIDFDPPVKGLQLEGGAFGGTLTLEAFNAGGGLLATDSFDYGDPTSTTDIGGAIELPMASSARDISTVVISYLPSPAVLALVGTPAFVVDDFVFVWNQQVDFEGLPGFTVVTDQFEGVDVSNGIIAKDPVDVLGTPLDLDPDGDNSLGAFPDGSAPITFTFDEPASNISLQVSSFGGTLTVDSFNADGSFISSESFSFGGVIGLPIALSVSGASSIEVSNTAGYVMDDLAFSFGAVECDAAVLITNNAPGTFAAGVTTVRFTATDSAGNSSSCSAVVTVNTRPVADAGADQTVECTGPEGAFVTLDGSGSSDPDLGDSLSFEWFDGAIISIGTTAILSLPEALPLGTHTFFLLVTDTLGIADVSSVMVTVEDTTAPAVTVLAAPDYLWPANHKMIDVSLAISVQDDCDTDPTVVLMSIVSNESDNGYGVGDGNTSNDIEIVDEGNIRLRAERQGKGDGRIYTLLYRVTDASGNFVDIEETVEVPHDQGSHSCDNVDCDLNSI